MAVRPELEKQVRALCAERSGDDAATAALRGYGPEIYGLLASLHRSDEDAADAFSLFSESFWRGLPSFARECSLRTWMYVIARNASIRLRKGARRHVQGHVPLSQDSAVEGIAEEVRTSTQSFLRTERRDHLAALRDTLPLDDKTLLVLRIDKGLAWEEIARVMLGEKLETEPDVRSLSLESARLRKRFQLVKVKLVKLGRERGLLP